jgi:DNA-binding transcriptional LysR family regulator
LHIGFAKIAKQANLRQNPGMDINLDDAALFARVAELGTLSAAARERNEPVSQISRAIVRLETALGVRLLHRSTHGLSLTDEGDTFLSHARRMLDTAAELDSALTGKLSGPSGWVRVSVSPVVAELVIAPSLRDLYAQYPQLHIEICADDRAADLARDGIDIAIRSGVDVRDTLVAQDIGSYGRSLYAAPSYVKQWGMPQWPSELSQHHLIGNSASPSLNLWPLYKALPASTARALSATPRKRTPNIDVEVLQVKGDTRADNTAVVLALALSGVGIARLNDSIAHALVQSGQLLRILPGFDAGERLQVYAVMLQERHRLPKVRACIDHWQSRFTAMSTAS